MEHIIKDALAIRRAHTAQGIPMIESQGFKEANIAFVMGVAMHQAGYFAFPEFPFDGGSIDAVFVRESEAVICEWKQLSPASIEDVIIQTQRMSVFDPEVEFAKHRFRPRKWTKRNLWVCDTWNKNSADWWMNRPSPLTTPRPFDAQWSLGEDVFASFGRDWYPYSWLWAYT